MFFKQFKTILKNKKLPIVKFFSIIYWSFTILGIVFFITSFFIDFPYWPKLIRIYVFAVIIIVQFCKFLTAVVLCIEDVFRLVKWNITRSSGNKSEAKPLLISRSTFISKVALIAGGIPLATLIYGMVKNAYNYKIKRVTIKLPQLPTSFKGLKIIQISDIHSGSFVFTAPIEKAVELINNEHADIIFFTGDLVNYKSSEAYQILPILSKIRSKYGIFSVLGNHDYGDYLEWDNEFAKAQNMQVMYQIHKKLGWQLLLNENKIINISNIQLAVIGVENWSAHKRFINYGNLSKAYEGAEQADVKLLLSHDPSHWDAQVNQDYKNIDVTFSGHTHGMQFGVEIPGFKWSPVQYLYKQWAGLYSKKSQYLYVNRGLGFIGYPGRVGILPEISVIELLTTR